MKKIIFLILIGLVLFLGERAGNDDLQNPNGNVSLHVISHGYHAGFVIEKDWLKTRNLPRLQMMASQFSAAARFEIGWGDAQFYQANPTNDDMKLLLAAKALLLPNNKSVLHIVGFSEVPNLYFAGSDILTLAFNEKQISALLAFLEQSFEGEPLPIGHGLYGASAFYHAKGNFSLFSVCNHFVARGLNEAGLRVNMVLSTLPSFMFWYSAQTKSTTKTRF